MRIRARERRRYAGRPWTAREEKKLQQAIWQRMDRRRRRDA